MVSVFWNLFLLFVVFLFVPLFLSFVFLACVVPFFFTTNHPFIGFRFASTCLCGHVCISFCSMGACVFSVCLSNFCCSVCLLLLFSVFCSVLLCSLWCDRVVPECPCRKICKCCSARSSSGTESERVHYINPPMSNQI